MSALALPGWDEVHLWHITLGGSDHGASTDALVDTLPRADARRADRIGHPAVRERFIRCQSALRAILADYLALEPCDLRFSEGAWGKPALAGPAATSGLAFNLTHSGALALLAVTRHREVGVDVERLRPLPDALDLAERYFSAPEREDLRRVAGTKAEALTFFQCWTRKEAFIKALGRGMYEPLDGFAVSCLPGEPARVVWCREDAAGGNGVTAGGARRTDAMAWTMVGIEPAAGYVGAVAVVGGCEIVESGWVAASGV